MSSDIVNLLHLNKELSSRVTLVKQINRCDGTFITSCVLNHCIKSKSAVLLVSTHNSFQHYQNVGLKMNYNLQRHMDTGLIAFFNLGEYCVNSLLCDNKLPKLYPKLQELIQSMQQKHALVNVIVDGISHLFDLSYTLRDINSFCGELISLVTSYNESFFLAHCDVAHDDDISCVMSNLLSHKAHTVLEVENLSSGWSTDVSGHLTIKYPGKKFDVDHLYTMDIKPSKYLFKLFERGIRLFAPGTV